MTTSIAAHPDTGPASGVFGRSRRLTDRPHEQVVFHQDAETGLRAIVAIHSTALGPALGGTRFYPYADEATALEDVLRLSWGMTYKAAVSGVDLGGGKAVIIGDPKTDKNDELLAAYGRFVESLGGRYITAADVGTRAEDLDVVGRHTAHAVGRTVAAGGSGDSSPLTALGVFQAMRAGARTVWGETTLAGRTVGVEGLGKVGYELVKLLVADGAEVIVSDVNPAAVARVLDEFPAQVADSVVASSAEVYAPCALGGTLTPSTASLLDARLVCGAANNQLAVPEVENILGERGIVWVPDYVANAGGLIQVAGEVDGSDAEVVRGRVESIFDRTTEIFDVSGTLGVTPGAAANRIAERRIDTA
ncbi:valine dehydrogenase [Rhodococcus gordoniae]|uniref:Valine dehydrogenase n=1 Tax=Rhodococcus gordoniae TaxID=223392 RepID=A0A379LZF9_9NOCA|nr:Glu/Leu/Phe/Val dehydrogenase dimerization domain-containing protein [Rhodococcus gordoniae]SUE15440.1 valine dehydrogenase [Rhodococcus gordoniae]